MRGLGVGEINSFMRTAASRSIVSGGGEEGAFRLALGLGRVEPLRAL